MKARAKPIDTSGRLITLKSSFSKLCSSPQNLLNSGSQHLSFLFENKLTSNDLTLSDELLTTTTASPWFANSTGLIDGDYERRKFNELWSFYLFMFNLALVCSSIVLQLLVGILLLLNTKSSRKNPSMPRRSGECYNHLILVRATFVILHFHRKWLSMRWLLAECRHFAFSVGSWHFALSTNENLSLVRSSFSL